MSSRLDAIAQAPALIDDGAFEEVIGTWVAIPSTNQTPEEREEHTRYLEEAIAPAIKALGCAKEINENPVRSAAPFLIAVPLYGHGDTAQSQDDSYDQASVVVERV